LKSHLQVQTLPRWESYWAVSQKGRKKRGGSADKSAHEGSKDRSLGSKSTNGYSKGKDSARSAFSSERNPNPKLEQTDLRIASSKIHLHLL
jgi:hypothetical protein